MQPNYLLKAANGFSSDNPATDLSVLFLSSSSSDANQATEILRLIEQETGIVPAPVPAGFCAERVRNSFPYK